MRAKTPWLYGAALAALAAAAANSMEDTSAGFFLPPATYPVVSLFGGVARGASYAGAAAITTWAAGHPGSEGLADVGTMAMGGVGFGFYPTEGFGVQLRLSHAFAPRRHATLSLDAGELPVTPGYGPGTVREEVSYTFHNVDLKPGVKWTPFASTPASPYLMAGAGINSTIIRIEDRVSDPWLQKTSDGFLLGNAVCQRFSFGWTAAGGVEARIGPTFIIFAEYIYDRPFANHFVRGYEYDAAKEAIVLGGGWRFL